MSSVGKSLDGSMLALVNESFEQKYKAASKADK